MEELLVKLIRQPRKVRLRFVDGTNIREMTKRLPVTCWRSRESSNARAKWKNNELEKQDVADERENLSLC